MLPIIKYYLLFFVLTGIATQNTIITSTKDFSIVNSDNATTITLPSIKPALETLQFLLNSYVLPYKYHWISGLALTTILYTQRNNIKELLQKTDFQKVAVYIIALALISMAAYQAYEYISTINNGIDWQPVHNFGEGNDYGKEIDLPSGLNFPYKELSTPQS
jgi:hypothetical protein